MKRPRLLLLLLTVSAALLVLPLAHQDGASALPASCDGYGDCVSTSLTYIRSNPDGTLYLGDQFEVTAAIALGPDSIGYSLHWSYDSGALRATSSGGSARFVLLVNSSRTTEYTVSAIATVEVRLTAGGSTALVSSQVVASVSVTAIPFILELSSRLENVTCSADCVLRNPDGTFYRGDAFYIGWNATFKFDAQRTDIRVNVTNIQVPQLDAKLISVLPRGLGGTFLYNVTTSNSYSVEGVELVAQAYDYYNDSLGLRVDTQRYAVVRYQPTFTYMAYMEYNYRNSSAYQRPFVTLVRYGGNQPGYSSPGGASWGPFDALNATGERAYIDNFTFSTTGWSTSTRGGNGNEVVTYAPSTGVEAGTKLLNSTGCSQEFTWSNRVQKYYIENANITGYALDGVVYFNTTMTAWSQDFPFVNDHQFLFNTSYLQEPILYNGYVTFQTYDGAGRPDPAVSNIAVKVTNPDPLDPYLISKVLKVFGNDSSVVSAFRRDLYAAYSSMTLVPVQQGGGEWVFLVNQTNVSEQGDLSSPTYSVSVSGVSTGASDYTYAQSIPFLSYQGPGEGGSSSSASVNYTYSFQGAFSLLVANRSVITSPFSNMTLYYFEPRGSLFLRPLNFTSFPQVGLYFVQSLDPSTPYTALSIVPGGAAQDYMFVWGRNTTVPVNVQGGLGGLAGPLVYEGGTEFQVTLMVGQMTGGGVAAWVEDQGGVLVNQTMTDSWPSLSSWAPPGYFGLQTVVFDAQPGDTSVTLHLKSSWGGEAVATVPIPTLGTGNPLDATVLITAVFLLTIGFYFLGELNKRIERPRGRSS